MHVVELRGPAKNALGTEMMRWLRQQLDEAAGEPLLLTGSDGAFSAGLNLAELYECDTDGIVAFLDVLIDLTEAMLRYPGPLVTYVNGHAIAGGCVLAICGDHRVVADDDRARIGLNEVALGLRFPPPLLRLVRSCIDPRTERQVILGAGLHRPADAVRLGMVDEVGDLGTAKARLEALATNPRQAYADTKVDLRRAVFQAHPTEAAIADDVLRSWTSDALRARLAAFLKR